MNSAHAVKRPYPPLLLRVVRSSILLWFGTRVAYVLVAMMGGGGGAMQFALHPVWPARLLLVGLTAVLVHLDRKLAHEHLLQANFGIPAAWFSATALLVAGLADLIVQALMPAL